MKKILLILLLFSINSSNVYSIEPDVFVQSTVNRASQILSKNISKEEKINQLKSIAKETVDIKGVGFYSLGSARKNLNDSQKIEYLKLFEDYFLKSFSSRLAEYTNPEIEVNDKNISVIKETKEVKRPVTAAPIPEPVKAPNKRIYKFIINITYNLFFNRF